MNVGEFKKRLEGIPDESEILTNITLTPDDDDDDETEVVTIDLRVKHNGCTVMFFEYTSQFSY